MGQAKNRAEHRARYEEGLAKKYKHLRTSCNLYDSGTSDEVDRIATEIISLCHSGSASSILANLGYARKEVFFDTAGSLPTKGLMSDWSPLTTMELGQGSFDFLPLLENYLKLKQVKLSHWWKKPVLKRFFHEYDFHGDLSDEEEDIVKNMLRFHSEYSRKNLLSDLHSRKIYPHISLSRETVILQIRNSEGAHFLKNKSMSKRLFGEIANQGFVAYEGNLEMLPKNTVLSATIRQIAYELLLSLETEFPNICIK